MFVRSAPNWSAKSPEEIAAWFAAPVAISVNSLVALLRSVDGDIGAIWDMPTAWLDRLDAALASGDVAGAQFLIASQPSGLTTATVDAISAALDAAIVTRISTKRAQIGADPNDPASWVDAPSQVNAADVTTALGKLGFAPNPNAGAGDAKWKPTTPKPIDPATPPLPNGGKR